MFILLIECKKKSKYLRKMQKKNQLIKTENRKPSLPKIEEIDEEEFKQKRKNVEYEYDKKT